MNLHVRVWTNRVFTLLAGVSVLLVTAALVLILLPMIWKAGGAVVFRATAEFRRMQVEQFKRGNGDAVQAERAETLAQAAPLYEIVEHFQRGINVTALEDQCRQAYHQLGEQLANRELSREQVASIRSLAKEIRDEFLQALDTTDKATAQSHLDSVLRKAVDARLTGTAGEEFARMAKDYAAIVKSVDLSRRGEYAKSLEEVKEELRQLFGPRPGEKVPAMAMEQYGATRWDIARQHLDRLMWADTWVSAGDREMRHKVRTPRQEQFQGTEMAKLFPLAQSKLESILHPRWTFYWQYFIDDSISGHYFGGVGPELLGTLLITVIAILIALPMGVIAAAYLIECARGGPVIALIRTCINTLAGVPSIVFGLFGLTFFVIYLFPKFGLPAGSSILAGSLTLALLVLPVMIRASEEAIRSVPQSYKEAALALGASRFRCFLTVTLPAAMPGILTGLILSMSRAAGETAPILFTAAIALGPVPTSLLQPTRTLSYGTYDMAVGDRIAAMVPHNQFGMVMTLVALVLVLNLAAIAIRSRVSRRLRGH